MGSTQIIKFSSTMFNVKPGLASVLLIVSMISTPHCSVVVRYVEVLVVHRIQET